MAGGGGGWEYVVLRAYRGRRGEVTVARLGRLLHCVAVRHAVQLLSHAVAKKIAFRVASRLVQAYACALKIMEVRYDQLGLSVCALMCMWLRAIEHKARWHGMIPWHGALQLSSARLTKARLVDNCARERQSRSRIPV